ncbi:M20/M25/M40 family metallo-hydrolase [Sedimentitalea arenosa]|jgi:acetylornithine deacetylase/succinyl-diaminopimelate desuccinylase-like protein|uniref:M20/M25/M40 family metallo-hydrolase n=1 Tax=Sedimentitalea arenosa TaxID=2798803 RepID=A0A8J7IUQ2_9RHOB|nr:M20/M25/M40 family metallo-hydrolase [Arenibacterium arenosum]MBJ6373141.1 M20/M25/M40 family metallo-hydrolase [Arenibacterium arenosum]
MALNDVLSRIDADLPAATDRLMELLRIPSISTDPAYKADCDKAADWLVADLNALGVKTEKRATPGHPMVVGHVDGDGPHLLFYGHYDVQPVDPLNLWTRDPFDPQIEDTPAGRVIRGRGASDDKGQLMTFVEACRAWKAVNGSLPCKITFFFEGEEESGSPSLVPFMTDNAEELGADIALICDTSMVARGVPSIASQLRGMLKDEFTIIGPRIDLHSGHYGGPGLNPLREIARIVASFHDEETGRVAVEGFYDGVHEVPADQLRQWQSCGFDEADYLNSVGYTQPHGEKDYSTLEQQWARPTLEINGLWGGYNGAGSKTVIPSEAHCKITCRLVGDMDPDDLRRKIRAHVEARLSPDAKVRWDNDLEGARASVMNIDRPEFEAARQALSDEWKREAVFCGMGGSIPIAGHFKSILGLDAMLIGYANEDDAIHSPNEKYDLQSFHKGIRSWARILDALTRA